MPTSTRPLPHEGGVRLDGILLFTVPFTILAWASSFPAIRAGLAGFGPAEMASLLIGAVALSMLISPLLLVLVDRALLRRYAQLKPAA